MYKYLSFNKMGLQLLILPVLMVLPLLAISDSTLSEAGQVQFTEFAKLIRWSGVITSVIIIFLAWFLLRIIHTIVDRISSEFVQRRLLLQKLETIAKFTIYIITCIIVFNLSLRVDDRVLAVIGGTLAVAVGFAMKDLVASIISGIMIMLERPFQVGDRLSFGGQYGDVISIGLRTIRLRTLDDNIVTIPNNKFLSDISISGNFGELDMHVGMDFYIGHDQDVLLAKNVIAEAAASSKYIHLPRPIIVLVNQCDMGNFTAIKLRLKAYVLDTQYEKMFETDVNLRVIEEFNRVNIKPAAVLHRTLDDYQLPEQPIEDTEVDA